MKRMMSLTVAQKLVAAFVLVSLLWASLCAVSFQNLVKTQHTYSDLLHVQSASLTMTKDIQYNVEMQNHALVEYMNTVRSGASGDIGSTKRFQDANSAIERLVQESGSLLGDPADRDTLQKIAELNKKFKTAATDAMKTMDTNMNKAVVMMKMDIAPISNMMLTHTNQIVKRQAEQMAKNEAATADEVDRTIWIVGIASIAVLVAAVAGSYLFARRMAKPIVRMAAMAEQIASGNLKADRTTHFSGDEIGKLYAHFHTMSDNLRELIERIARTSADIGESVEIWRNKTDDMNLASRHIASAMEEVQDATTLQSDQFMLTEQSAREVAGGVELITDRSRETADNAARMHQIARKGTEEMIETTEQMVIIGQSIRSLQDDVIRAGSKIERIGSIVDLISSIAKQTQILALNASIEASRAGGSGRGFTVIAEEVRKLSQQTTESADHIREFVDTIIAEINETVTSADHCRQESERGLLAVDRAKDTFDDIRQVFEQLSRQINEISGAAEQIDHVTRHVKEAMGTIHETAQTTMFRTQEVSAATEEQLSSMEEMAYSTNELGKLAQQLQSATNRFQW